LLDWLASVCRFGAEGIFRLLRTRRIVDAGRPVAELEQLALDPLVTPEVFSAYFWHPTWSVTCPIAG
jgi:hypothetical protein